MSADLYPIEYRLTRCLRCAKPIDEHRRFTAEDIEAVKGATYAKPVNGYRSPLSKTLVGQWATCEPMAWPERIAAEKARAR